MSANLTFKFSCIVPIYSNDGVAVEKTLQSLIQQTIGFKRNIQIVLVDITGSKDIENACEQYIRSYPSNVSFIVKRAKSIAEACNTGLKFANGRYVTFLCPEDEYSRSAFHEVDKFFEKYSASIRIITVQDESKNMKADRSLIRKFEEGARIIDLLREPEHHLLSEFGSFISRDIIRDLYFDTTLERCWRGTLINAALVYSSSHNFGVVPEAMFYHNSNIDAAGAFGMAGATSSSKRLAHKSSWLELMEMSLKNYGEVHIYLQLTVLRCLSSLFLRSNIMIMQEEERSNFLKLIDQLLRLVDDSRLLQSLNLPIEYRIYALTRKYRKDALKSIEYTAAGELCYDGKVMLGNVRNIFVRLEFIEVVDGNLVLQGWYNGIKTERLELVFGVGEKEYPVQENFIPYTEVMSLNEVIYRTNNFRATIPLEGGNVNIKPLLKTASASFRVKNLQFGKFANLQKSIDGSYSCFANRIILATENALLVRKYSLYLHIKREIKFLQKVRKSGRMDVVCMRITYHICRLIMARRQIWLLMDRPNSAGDNADYVFRYVNKLKGRKPRTYFALSKSDKRYYDLKKIGKIVEFGGFNHGLIYLLCSNIVSSHFDEYLVDHFGEDGDYFRDIYKHKFCYLGHGVLTGDLSKSLHRFRKNIDLLAVASTRERESIISNRNYGYGDNQVEVTGYPRFDGLTSGARGKVIFAPSWRLYLASAQGLINGIPNGKRDYNKEFKKSEFYRFYDRLINDTRIIEMFKEYGLHGEFYIHPNHRAQWVDFTPNELIKIMQPPHDYEAAFREGNLLVTDYSGVAFDFAYMKKPVIYAQFDKKEFYSRHTYSPSDFSFEDDGFGPVAYDYEETVKQIVLNVRKHCIMSPSYCQRVDRFFYYSDRNNSKRVYEAVKKIEPC